jgi:alpha-tubulin suppressor-like RCC1 family protein
MALACVTGFCAGCENVLGLDDARLRTDAGIATTTDKDATPNLTTDSGHDAGQDAGSDADADTLPLPDLANDAGPPLKVASLGEHTCAIGRDRRAYCWGDNTEGQLGDGTTESRDAPVLVKGPFNEDVVDISAGYTHSCLVRGNSDLYCWGKNDRGQLGDGTKDNRYEPGVLSMSGISKVGVAGWHTCAVTKLGTVRCWGDNYYGALGNGSFEPARSPTYIEVKGLNEVEFLAVGVMHNCAATKQGFVYCWGRAVFGEVGYPVDPDAGSPDPNDFGSPTATRVPNLTDIVEIAAGEDHTCAGKKDGHVYCWGRDDYAQLGDGDKSGIKVSPSLVQGDLTYAIRLAAGGFTSCATFTGGRVRCWGENNFGQLGNGNTTEGDKVPSPFVVFIDGVEQLSTNHHTCAWQRKGDVRRLFCWGRNDLGQLGIGYKSDYELQAREVIFPTTAQTSP